MLKAPSLHAATERPAGRARAESWTHEEFLAACLQRKVAALQSRGGEARIRTARFPARKALEDFDFDHQQSLKREVIAHLGTLDFRDQPWQVVQWSGRIGSWAAAQRVAARHGTRHMILLFADTLVEHPDLYRFSRQAAEQLGLPVVRVCDGRTPFELFRDVRFVGNNRIAPCSRRLKQIPARRWLEAHTSPEQAVLYVGIDHFEAYRAPSITRGWAPWRVEFPLCDEPYLTKDDMLAWATHFGLRPPALYFPPYSLPHNNCGGWYVRADIRQWPHMLTVDPTGFAAVQAAEQALRDDLGDVAILRDRRAGRSRPLPLSELRRRAAA